MRGNRAALRAYQARALEGVQPSKRITDLGDLGFLAGRVGSGAAGVYTPAPAPVRALSPVPASDSTPTARQRYMAQRAAAASSAAAMAKPAVRSPSPAVRIVAPLAITPPKAAVIVGASAPPKLSPLSASFKPMPAPSAAPVVRRTFSGAGLEGRAGVPLVQTIAPAFTATASLPTLPEEDASPVVRQSFARVAGGVAGRAGASLVQTIAPITPAFTAAASQSLDPAHYDSMAATAGASGMGMSSGSPEAGDDVAPALDVGASSVASAAAAYGSWVSAHKRELVIGGGVVVVGLVAWAIVRGKK